MTLPRAVGEDLNVTPIIVSSEAELRSLWARGLRWNGETTFENAFKLIDEYKGEYKDGKTAIDAQLADRPWLLVEFSSDNPMNYDGKVTLTKIEVAGASDGVGTLTDNTAYAVASWNKPAVNGRPAHTFWGNYDFKKVNENDSNHLGYTNSLPAAGSVITVTYTVGSGNDTRTFTKTVAFPTIVVPEKVQASATPAPETPAN